MKLNRAGLGMELVMDEFRVGFVKHVDELRAAGLSADSIMASLVYGTCQSITEMTTTALQRLSNAPYKRTVS